MQNLGNTCYFNTALQCLLHTPVLTNRFIIRGYDGPCIFTQEYNKIVRHMFVEKSDKLINPSIMLGEFMTLYPQFRPNEPSDVHETVLCIIDILEKSLDKEWIKKHFYGKLNTVIEGVKTVTEDFACIEPDDLRPTEIEDYEDDNGERRKVKITKEIQKRGSVYMVYYNQFVHKRLVDLPERIDGYRLYAAALHSMNHYIALVRRKEQWTIFNDEMKLKVEEYKPTGPFYFAMYVKSSS